MLYNATLNYEGKERHNLYLSDGPDYGIDYQDDLMDLIETQLRLSNTILRYNLIFHPTKYYLNEVIMEDDDVTNVEVFLRTEKPSVVENKEVEIKFNIPGGDIFAQKQSKTFEEAVDLAADALKRQITKRKEKLRGK